MAKESSFVVLFLFCHSNNRKERGDSVWQIDKLTACQIEKNISPSRKWKETKINYW